MFPRSGKTGKKAAAYSNLFTKKQSAEQFERLS